MLADREIEALLVLADDPDDDVFNTVADRLINYGREIIPNLEHVWESTADTLLQERMELLIHRVYFNDLQAELKIWSEAKRPDILTGAILVAKYHYPDLNVPAVLHQFDQIRRNVWLELNNYLTPLEQVNVINSIIYNYCKMEGHELTERNAQYFFINNVLESKKGNPFSLGVLYLALCDVLDVPVFAVDIPRQFILAYFDTLHSFFSSDPLGIEQIQFYVDPLGGMAYTQSDIDMYLRKINATDTNKYFVRLSNKVVIQKMLEELRQCYRYQHQDSKAEEISQLLAILADKNV
ncbi:MAG: transglutaminase family protein [Flavipsychrobacter sp.]|nr:transglutaminase family protein [Flavipsychrobacter sp.]